MIKIALLFIHSIRVWIQSSDGGKTAHCRLLIIIGLLLISPSCMAGDAAEIVLVTWNIEHLAAEDDSGCRPRQEADYQALHAMAQSLNATIIAVQEIENAAALARVFDPADYELIVSERPETRVTACRRRPRQLINPQRTGFALHRQRLAEQGLRWERLEDFAEIGFSYSSLRWGTRIGLFAADDSTPMLELMSLHLKAGCAWGALDRPQLERAQCRTLRRQRGILEEWIDDRAAAGQPFVLLGDFNRQLDQPRDDFWYDINDGAVCDWRFDADFGRRCIPGSTRPEPNANLTLANAGNPFPFPFNPRYPYAVDHFIFDKQSARWIVADSYEVIEYPDQPLSDHHPLRIVMRLPRSSI